MELKPTPDKIKLPRPGASAAEFKEWYDETMNVVCKRRMATFLGADDPRECIVPGHAYFIGERWIGPPYEQAWATFARAGLNGACECGWQSDHLRHDTEYWVDHLIASDLDWGQVEDNFTLRALSKLPVVIARSWIPTVGQA